MAIQITNRLINERSPYLLQHAYNPVDWYPWSVEAFDKAKTEDKPVFLSIGYSTCHWCHVMERESFEDEEVAAILNEKYIAIKVDREERPDIDAVYMMVCQLATGGGGWPLTIVSTPDKSPFFAGTYFPKHGRQNRAGLMEILTKLDELWQNNRDELNTSAAALTKALSERNSASMAGQIDEPVLHAAYSALEQQFDEVNGGFGNAPKFPTPHNLIFLLRYYRRSGNKNSLYMAEKTLYEMRMGGIFDHLGKGYHRYSTDRTWLLPHFEKMLYDQAMMLLAVTEAYSATQNSLYKRIAEEIVWYLQSKLLSPVGGFYSAEDADSEEEEGKFYVWKKNEFEDIAADDAKLLSSVFNNAEDGNFQEPYGGNDNILHITRPLDEIAVQFGITLIELQEKIAHFTDRAFKQRERRIHPFLDDKILTDWNGLTIAALAKAGYIFNNPDFILLAEKAANFILDGLKDKDNNLLHRWRDDHAEFSANLEDYAFFSFGLLELFAANYKPEYLLEAVQLVEKVLADFKDMTHGGFFLTSKDAELVLTRQKELYDGAIPSGNSVMAHVLHTLGQITGNPVYEFQAAELSLAFGGIVAKSPLSFTHFLCAAELRLSAPYEVVIAGDGSSPAMKRYLRELRAVYYPNLSIIAKDTRKTNDLLHQLAPFTEGMRDIDGQVMIYLCKNFSCDMPTTSIDEVINHFREKTV